MDAKTLTELWNSYEKKVIPESAGKVQRIETKKGFVAGAATMFGLMLSCLDPDEPTGETEEEVQNMENLYQELRRMQKELGREQEAEE